MKIRELLTEGLQKKDTYKILLKFIRFAAEHLKLNSLPKFDFRFDSARSVENKSFGGCGSGTLLYQGAISEKTNIDNRVAEGTNNLIASSNQGLLLIDNAYL